MKRRRRNFFPITFGILLALGANGAAADRSADAPGTVGFHRQVLPVLQANCLPCHNQGRAKAGLNLETRETMLKGGDSGPALVPGAPDKSPVFLAAAHRLEDSPMPPVGNKANARDLTPAELDLLERWIRDGANDDAPVRAEPAWKEYPVTLTGSLAVALGPDRHTAAMARANRVAVLDTRSGTRVATLEDPALNGASHRDAVQAIAFHPAGDLIATAGFREVRLWRRQPVAVTPAWTAPTGTRWTLASPTPDGQRIAVVTEDDHLEIRRSDDGTRISVHPLRATTPRRMAWDGTGGRIAVAGANGIVQVFDPDAESPATDAATGSPVPDLAWFGSEPRLVAAIGGSPGLRAWTLARSEAAGNSLLQADLPASPAEPVLALSAIHGANPGLIAVAASGAVGRWGIDGSAIADAAALPAGTDRLVPAGTNGLWLARTADSGVVVPANGQAAVTLGGDPRVAGHLAEAEDALGLSRMELARADARASEAEAAAKTAAETLQKATALGEERAKALADAEGAESEQRKKADEATRERDHLASELERSATAAREARMALADADTRARETAEAAVAARVAAVQAVRLRDELTRLAAALPEKDTGEAADTTRRSAAAAGIEAGQRTAAADAAADAATQARSRLSERAFEAGRLALADEQAQKDLPPRRQKAEERLAAAQKALPDLEKAATKARIAHQGAVQDIALAQAATNRAAMAIAQARTDGDIARERIRTAEGRIATLRTSLDDPKARAVAAMGSSPDGSAVVLFSPGSTASRWSLPDGSPTTAFEWNHPTPLAVVGIDAHRYRVVLPDRVVTLDTRRPWTLERVIGGNADPHDAFADRVTALAFSPDGTLLATGGGEPSRSGELKLWDTESGRLVRDFGPVHSDAIMSLAFSPRGDRLATGGADRFARITPVTGDGPRTHLEGHTHHVVSVAWLGDGSVLATGGADGVVKLWNPVTGERRKNVEGLGKEVTGLHRLGFRREFAAVSTAGQGRVFHADSGDTVRALPEVPAYIQSLAAARDGSQLVGTGDDGQLRIWDPVAGTLLRTIDPAR